MSFDARTEFVNSGKAHAHRRHARYYELYLRKLGDAFERGGEAARAVKGLETDFRNIRKGQAWAAAHSERDPEAAAICSRYADAAPGLTEIFMNSSGMMELHRSWLQDALRAARKLGYIRAESAHLDRLAMSAFDRGDSEEALRWSHEAIERGHKSRDLRCEATALGNCANVYKEIGRFPEAEQVYRRALILFQQLDDSQAIKGTLVHLAQLEELQKGSAENLTPLVKEALEEAQRTGDLDSERFWLNSLANELNESDPAGARAIYEQALRLARDLRDRSGESSALAGLAVIARHAGDVALSVAFSSQSLEVICQHPNPFLEAHGRMQLTVSLFEQGSLDEARANARFALQLFSRIQSRHAALLQEFLAAIDLPSGG